MAELEDGEICDSPTSDSEPARSAFRVSDDMKTFSDYGQNHRGAAISSYRSVTPKVNSSSDSDSDQGEEDTPMWRQKKEKYFRKNKESSMVVCSSPTLPEFRKDNSQNGNQKKKKNDVWGSVLTEQDLTQTLVKSAGVDKNSSLNYNERNVESYDFTKKYQDSRPPQQYEEIEESVKNESNDPFGRVTLSSGVTVGRSIIDYEDTVLSEQKHPRKQGTKRKASEDHEHQGGSVRDRLGFKKVATMSLRDVDLSPDMDEELLVKTIADVLHEAKIELIEGVVHCLGKAIAIKLLQLTKDVEDGGGMFTIDGSRRRTPGGVYLQLLKQQPEYTPEHRKIIFKEEMDSWKICKKEKRRQARERKKNMGKKHNRHNSNSKSRSPSQKTIGGENLEEKMDDDAKSTEFSLKPKKAHQAGSGMLRSRSHSPNQDLQAFRKGSDVVKSKNNSSKNGHHGKKHYQARTMSNSKSLSRSLSSNEEGDDSDNDKGGDRREKGRNPGRSGGAFNFEDELAAAKSLILARSKTEKNKDDEEMNTEEAGSKHDAEDMNDLDEEEAHVVDIQIGEDTID